MNLTYNDKKKYSIVYENRMPLFHENRKVFVVKIKLPNERITKYQYIENEQVVQPEYPASIFAIVPKQYTLSQIDKV
jgi:hypothetical protein